MATGGAVALPGGPCPLTSVSDVTGCLSSLSLSVTDLGQRSVLNEVNMQLVLMTETAGEACLPLPTQTDLIKFFNNHKLLQIDQLDVWG